MSADVHAITGANVLAQLQDTGADRLDVSENTEGHASETDFQLSPDTRIPQLG